MRPNRKEPELAPFWFQSLSTCCRPQGGLLQGNCSVGDYAEFQFYPFAVF